LDAACCLVLLRSPATHTHTHTQAKPAKRQYAAVAKAISQFEPVTMWADPSVVEDAKSYLTDAPNVTVKVGSLLGTLF
jgi:agmatine/peptidylarginine deiminase